MDDILGHFIKYDCSRNSSAENIEELEPKKFRYKLTSNLNLGTKLCAKSIYIITTQLSRLNFKIVNESGRHKASRGVINHYTFAEIKYPLENVLNSISKRKALNN